MDCKKAYKKISISINDATNENNSQDKLDSENSKAYDASIDNITRYINQYNKDCPNQIESNNAIKDQ